VIVDTSALLAVLIGDDDAHLYERAMTQSVPLRMSAGSWIEFTAVLVRRFPELSGDQPERLISEFGIVIMPVTIEQAQIGRAAYRVYGRGTMHRAALNFGDCFAYALAKATGEPLLFKGNDFTQTDIVPAL
jgi:ribonuclease VapC